MKSDLINKIKQWSCIWMPVMTVVLCRLVLTGIAFAHDCSSEADCLQTAGYNTVLSVGGGIIAIIAALLSSHLGGLAGTLTPTTEVPPDTDTKGAEVETTPEGPVIIDADGEPLPNWSPEYLPGENGYAGKPGDVWYNGNWVDPDYAREQVAEDIHYDNLRDIEREAFWSDVQDASAQWLQDRHNQLEQEALIERQENQSRQDALDLLDRIEDSAIRHGATDILQRAEENAWNPDGSINPDYVNRLRDVMRNRIGLDIAAPDEQLQQGWVGEFVETTFDDARHNPLIRIGAGILSGGTSEIIYQGQSAWEAMQESYDEAVKQGKGDEWGYGDALLAGGQRFVEENLPVNIIKTAMDPNATTTDFLVATAMDMFTSMDTAETIQNLRGSFSTIRGGGGIWDAMTHRADPIKFFPGEETDIPTGPHDIDGAGGRIDVEGPRGLDDGARGLDDGARGLDDGARGLDDGARGLDDGARGLDDGARGLDDGARGLDDGARGLDDGARGLDDGARGLDDGAKGLDDGARSLDDGARGLDEGAGGLDDGARGLDDGTSSLDDGARGADEGVPGGRGADEGVPGRAPDEGGPGRVEAEGEPGLEGQRGQEGDWGSEGSRGMERNVDDLPEGSPVGPAEYGIPDSNARGVQQVADEFDVDIEMRQTNPDATMKLEEGGYPPKHCEIKTKTGGELDEMLGLPPGHRGEAVYFEPQLPEGMKYDDLSPELQNRFNQRFEEYAVQGPKIQQLEADGLIKVEDGVIINTGLNKNPDMQNLPFAGDHDVFRITPRDGSELTTEMENAIVNRLSEYGNGGHGSHMSSDWDPQNVLAQDARYNIANNHLPVADGGGGESLIKFSPGQEPVSSFANSGDMSSLTQPPELRDIEFFDQSTGQWTR